MTRVPAVPLGGLAFIVGAAFMLGTVVSRSPYTHANLLPSLPPDYDRTRVDTLGEANPDAVKAELAQLPPPPTMPPSDRRLAVNTVAFLGTGARPPRADSSAFGKALFSQRCSSCHSIGGGRRVGPDLRAITDQRPRDWLIQFILAPDRVIASGDPLATQLVKAYAMPMPNLGLARPQAEALLAYIERKSAEDSAQQAMTVSASASGAAPAPGAGPAGQDTSAGKRIFEQKCASCHSIGGGKLVGPDLKGTAAQRSRDWLIEFIVAPDRLIASGDATAMQLVKEYGMPMPNLGVTADQAEEILAHIDLQSGIAPAPAAPARAAPTPAPAATVEASPSPRAKEEPRPPTPTSEEPKPSPTATRQATPLPPVKQEARPSPTATAAPTPTPPPVEEEPTSSPPPPAGVSFANDVLPVLQRSCAACHGTMGGWSVASYASVMNSGEHKPIVVPGDPDGSLLVQKLKGTQTIGQRMPMGGSLPADTIQKIAEWIKAGAKDN